ncbi:hypothetical protein ACJJTC_004876 [Scirpophaga incertulas]
MDNEQLKRLKKKRSSYKGQLTLFENYLLALDDTTLSKRQVMELQLRITKLESVLKEFDAVQLDIECICDDAQLEISERELVETKYYSLVTEARQMLNSTEDDGESQCVDERLSSLPNFKVCYNCFRHGHYSNHCKKNWLQNL